MAARLLAFVILASGAWLVHASRAPVATATPAAQPPVALGAWEGTPLPVEPRAKELVETEGVVLAEYRQDGGTPVWLAEVTDVGNRGAFHPPELCYVGSHYEVLARGPRSVVAGGAPRRLMQLVIGQGRARYVAWYWFTAGGQMTPSYYQQQLWLVLGTATGRPVPGQLVRISTPLEDGKAAEQRLLSFLEAFLDRPAQQAVRPASD